MRRRLMIVKPSKFTFNLVLDYWVNGNTKNTLINGNYELVVGKALENRISHDVVSITPLTKVFDVYFKNVPKCFNELTVRIMQIGTNGYLHNKDYVVNRSSDGWFTLRFETTISKTDTKINSYVTILSIK